jgi:hypothetical protein
MKSRSSWLKTLVLSFLLASALNSCTPTRNVKPLKKGDQQIAGSFGGPIIQFGGNWIPIPFTSVAYSRGISDAVTGFWAIHTTAALFGNFQAEAGSSFWLYHTDTGRFSFSGNASLQLAGNLKSGPFRIWPQVELSAIRDYGKKGHFVYLGGGSRIETGYLANSPAGQSAFIPYLQVGHIWEKKKWQFQLEAKWIAPGLIKDHIVVDVSRTPFAPGTPGIYFGFSRKL